MVYLNGEKVTTKVEIPEVSISIGKFLDKYEPLTSLSSEMLAGDIRPYAFTNIGYIQENRYVDADFTLTRKIGAHAFSSATFGEIKFGSNLEEIGDYGFGYVDNNFDFSQCTKLRSIGYHALGYTNQVKLGAVVPPEINEPFLSYERKTVTVYIPAGSLEAYNESWKAYGNISYNFIEY